MHNIQVHKSYIMKRIIIYLVVLFVFVAIFIPGLFTYYYYNNAKLTLRDAKNIQLAMRVLSIQYYGRDRNVYVPGRQYGMAEDTIAEVKRLSGVEGDITLVSWNPENNVPGKFYYQTETYLVVYEFEPVEKELTWDIYYIRPILELG